MRVFVVSIILMSLTLLPHGAAADMVSTIDELASMYNVEACAECHEDIHDEWKESWHGQSITDSRVLRTWRTFVLRGLDKSTGSRRDLKDVCLPCHAPQIKDASDDLAVMIADLVVTAVDDKDEAKRDAAKKELSKLNINCVICHNTKAVPDGSPEAKAVYGPKSVDEIDASAHEEAGLKTIKSDYLSTSEFCAQCHHGCPPGMPSSICPTLWTSYQEKYLAGGGTQTCQDCHMKSEEDYKSHRFPGIYEVEQVKQGIQLTLSASPTQYVYHLQNRVVPAVVMNVQLKNTAGHGIPHG